MKLRFLLCLALVLGGVSGCRTGQCHPAGSPVVYHNRHYKLTFALSADWKGYSVVVQQWEGQAYSPAQDRIITTEHGPIIVLRNPKWMAAKPCQDIPIMIFTRRQWKDIHAGKFNAAGAGGIIYELWHNDAYVFGIHSRYNWYELKGWQQTDDVIQQNSAAHKEPHLYPE